MTLEYLHTLDEITPVMLWIDKNHPDCLKFNCTNDSTLRSIAVYHEYNKKETYITMIMSYGVLFVLAYIEYHKEIEDYERCSVVLEAIKHCNDVYKCELPTRLYSKWVNQNRFLKPSEILAKHFHA